MGANIMRKLAISVLLLISIAARSQCLFDVDVSVLNEPFCPTSFDGQLEVVVTGVSGDFSYQWLDAAGNNPPGGPQSNPATLPYLMPNQTYWAYVIDNTTSCTDSISYSFGVACHSDTAELSIETPFDVNPVNYNTWSTCEVRINNLGCDLHFKPEFRVSHISDITQGDFEVEYYNAQSNWVNIPYTINVDGDAVGYWGDDLGEIVNCNSYQSRPVRVKFSQNNPEASLGNYIAYLSVWSADANGDLLEVVSDTIPINLMLDNSLCENLTLSSQGTDASCPEVLDGQIQLFSSGGLAPYQYSIDASVYAADSVFDVSGGAYVVGVLDANNCELLDAVVIAPEPLLPDTVWFTNTTATSVDLNWDLSWLIDGYHFRYRLLGSLGAFEYIGVGGFNNDILSIDSVFTLQSLLVDTTYEVQLRVNSLEDCIEGWSQSYYFTTSLVSFDFNTNITCIDDVTGSIETIITGQGVYSFMWIGPNSFTSSDTSIFQLEAGVYLLQILDDVGNSVLDTSFTISTYPASTLSVTVNGDPSSVTESFGQYYAQVCYQTDQLQASDGFTNYLWNNAVAGQMITPWQTLPYYVQAIDSNGCSTSSNVVNTTVVTDFIDFYSGNNNEDYIQLSYNHCTLNPPIELDVSDFISGDFSVQWTEQIIGGSVSVIGNTSSISLSPTEDAHYDFSIGGCYFDFYVNVYPSPILTELNLTDVSCYGLADGFVEVEVSAEVLNTPFTYAWYDSTGVLLQDEQSSSITNSIGQLPAGVYTATVTDAEFCSGSMEVEIGQPDSLFLELSSIQNNNCNGESIGQVTVEIGLPDSVNMGGTAPYTFSLNGASFQTNSTGSVSYSDLTAGNYSVSVSDANNCTAIINLNITEPSTLSLTDVSPNQTTSCNGVSDGTVDLLISGGTSPFDIYMNGSIVSEGWLQSTFNQVGLAEGDYDFQVIDSLGCIADLATITIQQPDVIQLAIVNQINVGESLYSCSGDSAAWVEGAVLTGGTPPFDYQLEYPNGFWTNYTSTTTYSSLFAGQYTLNLIDGGGCESSLSFVITEPDPITYIPTILSHVSCFGGNSGAYSYQISGGVSPYQDVNGNPLPASGVEVNLSSGNYNIQVFDSNLCETTSSVNILEPDSLTLSVDSIVSVLCYGANQGSIYAHVEGGTAPYEYYLNGTLVQYTASTYVVFNELYASSYNIEVIDAYDCPISVGNVVVSSPASTPLTITESYHQDASCYQAMDGIITVAATGGCGNYTYWMDYITQGSGVNANEFTDLEEDEYVLTVIDDCGCSDTLVTQITQANYLLLDTTFVQDESCFNACDGTIHLTASGGSGSGYQFSIDQVNYQPSSIFEGLCAGTYQLSVLNNSCDTFIVVEIGSPALLQITDISIQDVSCFGVCDGVVEVQANGGTLPYTYSLNGGVLQSGNEFSSLCPDVYAILVEDAQGCSKDSVSVFTELVEPDTLVFSILAMQDISCYGANNGVVVVSVDNASGAYGGTAPYTFTIDGGDMQTSANPSVGDVVFDNLAPGDHLLEIIDANSCTGTLTIHILQPTELNLTISSQTDTIDCFGLQTAFIELYATGGNPTYTYTLENTTTTLGIQQSEWFFNLGADDYTITVEDVNNCQTSVNVFVEENPEIIIQEVLLQHEDVSCYADEDGSFELSISGGVPGYEVNIVGETAYTYPHYFTNLASATYNLEVRDTLGCLQLTTIIIDQPDPLQFSTFVINDALCFGDSTGSIVVETIGGTPDYELLLDSVAVEAMVELPNGIYLVEVTDINNCSIDSTVSVNQPTPLTAVIDVPNTENVSCYSYSNGQINVLASGGTANYLYQANSNSVQSSSLLTNLSAGLHYITVIDNNNCEFQTSWELTEPDELVIENYTLSDNSGYCALCDGDETGWVTVDASGGTPTYQYYLNGVANFPLTSSLIQGLVGGDSYSLSVQDDNGCWSEGVEVECSSSTPIIISQDEDNFVSPSCCYTFDGQIEVQTIGGAAPLSFSLNNGPFQNMNIFNDLYGGSYCVTAQDANGCEQDLCEIFLNTPTCLELDTINYVTPGGVAVANSDSCWYYDVGEVYVEATGGTGFYEISFADESNYEPIDTGAYFNDLSVGNYWVYLRDSLNCQDSISVMIEGNSPIQISDYLVDTVHCDNPCVNEVTGLADVGGFSVLAYGGTLDGSTPSLSYSVDELDSVNYQFSGTFQNLTTGNYSVNIKDDQDCVLELDLEVPGVSAYLTYETYDITCFGYDNGMAQVLTLDGGYSPWVELDGNGPSTTFFNLSDGTHEIAAVYNYPPLNPTQECICPQTFVLDEPEEIVVEYEFDNPSCYDSCDGWVEVSAWGGFEPYQFIWLNTADTVLGTVEGLCGDYYGLQVLDASGCEVIETITLTDPSPIYPLITQSGDSLIVLEPTLDNPTVGVAPYTYQWVTVGMEIPGADGEVFVPLSDGVYTVMVTDANGCEGYASEYDYQRTLILNVDGYEFTAYPNPVKDRLYINTSLTEEAYWEVHDVYGKIVLSGNNKNAWDISMEHLSAGAYMLQIEVLNHSLLYKIIKQ
jgi:large repetitive protein